VILWAFFGDHAQDFDDIGLFNIPYMYANYGDLTYPAHGQFDALTIHPPIHYWLIGVFMKMGIEPFYAEAIAPALLMFLGILLVLSSRFAPPIKVGLLLGLCVPLLFSGFLPGMRPDVHRALALYCGLIALESGRSQNWDARRLFLGSFFLTYASALHYPGFAGFLGALIYVLWLIRVKPVNWRSATIALMAGGTVVGLPYLLLFVIPFRHEIFSAVSGVQAVGDPIDAVRVHLRVYAAFIQNPDFGFQILNRILFFPVVFGVPLVFFAFPALWLNRCTRGMAWAALPYPLFLLFFAEHKVFWPGYFLPEFMLYAAGIGILLSSSALYVCGRFLRPLDTTWSWSLVTVFFVGALLSTSPPLHAVSISLKPRIHEAAIARGAGRLILGPNAWIGSRNAIMFYAAGGSHYYDVSPDLLWAKNPARNLDEYFRSFDSIVEHRAFSSLTLNPERKSLSSWYADGSLKLRGFFFSSRHQALRQLYLQSQPSPGIVGFVSFKDGQILRFYETEGGDHLFVAAVCKRQSPPDLPNIFRDNFLLPEVPGEEPLALQVWLVRQDAYLTSRLSLRGSCQIREEISLGTERLNAERLLDVLMDDRPIRFFRYLEEFIHTRYGPLLQLTLRADGWPASAIVKRGEFQGLSYSMTPETNDLFRNDVDSVTSWQAHRYGSRGGADIQSDGLTPQDTALRYSTGDPRDHLTSPYLALSERVGPVFFSVWIKPSSANDLPTVRLQDKHYTYLSSARPTVTRPDGWILLTGLAEIAEQQEFRVVITQKNGTTSLLDKLLLVSAARK
jgi:hypothetical protein